MRKVFLVIVGGLLSAIALGQQLPQTTLYFTNPFIYNPAVAGVHDYWDAQFNSRFQWVGINDAPRMHYLTAHGPLKNYKMGLGGTIFADITGPTRRTGFNAAYSYKLQITEELKLGMGIEAGVLQYVTDGSQILLKDGDDPALSNGFQSVITPNATVGFHLYTDEYYFGFAVPQIIGNKLRFFDDFTDTEARLNRHLFVYGGYKFVINDQFTIEPSALIKYVDPIPVQWEMNVRAFYKNAFWIGGSYRMDDALALTLGYIYQDMLSIAYAYDYSTTELSTYSSGSHEIVLGIRFAQR